jgi:hypothetical protein
MIEETCPTIGRVLALSTYVVGSVSLWGLWHALKNGTIPRWRGHSLSRTQEPLEYWTYVLGFASGVLLLVWQLTRAASPFC